MRLYRSIGSCSLCLVYSLLAHCAEKSALPENLARAASASADSEFSADYAARFATDGDIPAAGASDDPRRAWCVRGDTHRNGAVLTLAWDREVTIAQIVYFGRTSWFAEECWKGYEVALDGGDALVRGEFAQADGAQRITLPQPTAARRLTLRFTSSYGGLNPGAAEIMVFARPVPKNALGALVPLPPGRPVLPPPSALPVSDEYAGIARATGFDFEEVVLIHRHELDPTHVYTQHVEGFRPGGGLYAYGTATGELRKLVASPEGQILDCDVSFDGRAILFSWRATPNDAYQLHTIGADGTALRQLTRGEHHNYNACWLPDGGIAFLSTRRAQFAYCWVSPVGTVCRMEADGSGFRQLSGNYLNDFTPAVLNDGRLIYGRWEYVDRPAIPIQSLWTLNPDGTQLRVFFGNRVLSPATFIEPRPIPGGARVLCILTAHNGPCRGAIGIIDPAHGVNAQEAIRNLTPEVAIGRIDRGDGNSVRGPYESPWPVDGEFFLVSNGGTIELRDYATTQRAVLLQPAGGMGFYSPQPIRTRVRPPVIASTLPPRTPEEDAADPEQPAGWATVILQDVYRGLAPGVARGEIKELRVVQEMRKAVRTDVNNRAFGFQFPVISCGATYACKKVWGHVPVAEDGSATFRVPAGVPLYFEALDAEGRALQRMRSFTHLMPGEVQGCIGCHEPRGTASGAHAPAALGARTPPDAPAHPEWGPPEGFDYSRIVQPVLDRHCIACHAPPAPPNGLDLTGDKTDFFNVSYDVLARANQGPEGSPYVSWIPTYNGQEANILKIAPRAWGSPASKLAQVIRSGHPDKDGKPRIALDQRSTRRIFAWIDLNVPYYGTSETAYPEKPGCRQLYPPALDATLADVGCRRCAECHKDGAIPRKEWTRITNPQLNPFLTAPLAKSAGGSERCGKAVFADTNDPDYRAVLETFAPIAATLAARPRMDMPGARPAADINRSCK